jgi:dTDP-glucose 4,6-dehydratase
MRPAIFSSLPVSDLDELIVVAPEVWEALRGARIFMTGASGFIGRWMLESLFRADQVLELGIKVTVLVRNVHDFKQKTGQIAQSDSLNYHIGDVRNFVFPSAEFTHVIHLAVSSDAVVQASDPRALFSVIVDGAKRTLECATISSASKFLLVSSGAVYGPHSSGLAAIPESYLGTADCTLAKSVYATAKRAAEQIGVLSASSTLDVMIARPFAFIGPGVPLDAHFAVGNFIRDGLGGTAIQINGDGSPLRSYLYAADMAWWLWKILVTGTSCRPYNVGGEQVVSIGKLAEMVAHCFDPQPNVLIKFPATLNKHPENYVPDISRAQQELYLYNRIQLSEAIHRTIGWHTVAAC